MATIHSSMIEGVKVIQFTGSLTCEGVEQVGAEFEGELHKSSSLVIDLAKVDLIATPGLCMLLSADRQLKQGGGKMVLAGSSAFIQDLLHRCKLDTVWAVVPNRDEAIRLARTG